VAHYDLGSPADTDIYHVVVAQRGIARLIKEEGADIRTDVHDQIGDVRVGIGGLRNEMHEGFAAINRHLDQIIQTQLDEHTTRIKKLETAVFSK
jgi:hypothetical protein